MIMAEPQFLCVVFVVSGGLARGLRSLPFASNFGAAVGVETHQQQKTKVLRSTNHQPTGTYSIISAMSILRNNAKKLHQCGFVMVFEQHTA